jgi:hypothetical protein
MRQVSFLEQFSSSHRGTSAVKFNNDWSYSIPRPHFLAPSQASSLLQSRNTMAREISQGECISRFCIQREAPPFACGGLLLLLPWL